MTPKLNFYILGNIAILVSVCRVKMAPVVPLARRLIACCLKHVTTLSVHIHIGAQETLRPSPEFFHRGNIVAYEVLPMRDHYWLKTLPNNPPG